MSEILELDRLVDIVGRGEGATIQSTGATVVSSANYPEVLYNVTGSTHDPAAVPGSRGNSWIGLLRGNGLGGGACNVISPLSDEETSHPKYQVGGHMTENQNGIVPYGGDSYLMPLCKWHNSTSRDEVPFRHQGKNIIRLSGYMQGELAESFVMRFPSNYPMAMLYYDQGLSEWNHKNLSNEEAAKIESGVDSEAVEIGAHILFERQAAERGVLKIKEINIPSLD
jgi:hypothetical protein